MLDYLIDVRRLGRRFAVSEHSLAKSYLANSYLCQLVPCTSW